MYFPALCVGYLYCFSLVHWVVPFLVIGRFDWSAYGFATNYWKLFNSVKPVKTQIVIRELGGRDGGHMDKSLADFRLAINWSYT